MQYRGFILGIVFCSVLFMLGIISPNSTCNAQARRYEVSCPLILWNASMDSVRSQIGVGELTGNNDGVEVEEYLRSVKLKKGNKYCIAGQYWGFYVAARGLGISTHAIPLLQAGLVAAVFNDAAKKGTRTDPIPQPLDIVCWKFARTISGHAERIDTVKRAGWIVTVGFNTPATNNGDQRDGSKSGSTVNRKLRNILHPLGRMNLSGFIGRKS